jgi:Ca2+-binding EF-hand superfamily protein
MQSRKNKINEIFDRLDNDNDGLISTAKVNLSVLSEELL